MENRRLVNWPIIDYAAGLCYKGWPILRSASSNWRLTNLDLHVVGLFSPFAQTCDKTRTECTRLIVHIPRVRDFVPCVRHMMPLSQEALGCTQDPFTTTSYEKSNKKKYIVIKNLHKLPL